MNLAEDPRAGLELIRYHSWAKHRQQSNGEHSCQMLRILLTVWPDAPRRLLVAIVLHDIGEMAGDVQYPYKQRVPGLKQCMDGAEAIVRDEMRAALGLPAMPALSDYERAVLKLCDYLEMWEYGLRECNMGSRYAKIVALRTLQAAGAVIEEHLRRPPAGCPDIVPAVTQYVNRRTKWEQIDG